MPAPAAAQPALERQYLTGDWDGVRPLLSIHGFEPFITYIALGWANLNGGKQPGVQPNGYLTFGFDLHCEKLGTWEGFGLHADFHWWQGPEPTQTLIGGVGAMALSTWEAASTFRVYNVYLRQAFGEEDRVVVKLGQIAADTDFMVSRYAGLFLNGSFGDLPSEGLNVGAPVYPLAAPGIFAAARVLPWLSGRFGAYTAGTGNDVAGNHGFQWVVGNNAGYALFAELALSAPEGWRPGTYTLGWIFDTGGSGAHGPFAGRASNYELYLMLDQAIVAGADGEPVLGAFTRVSGNPQSDRNVVSFYVDAGITILGLVPSRPRDSLGLAGAVMQYTEDFQRAADNSGSPVGARASVFEITYQIAATPYLVIQPDAQFFFNPSQSRRNAQALGINITAVF